MPIVQAELAEVFKVEPLKERPGPRTTEAKFLLASDITRDEAVRVATLRLP